MDCNGALRQIKIQIIHRLQPMRLLSVCSLVIIDKITKFELDTLFGMFVAMVAPA